jgi:RNA polymerase I-specific transcription initiation factor RRN11
MSGQKPSLLHALVLHLIKHDHYRAALDELETYIRHPPSFLHLVLTSNSYLSSYPYLLSGPLHTYAGMLAFYLAQPPSAQAQRGRARRSSSSSSSSHEQREAPNPGMIRQARGWFSKALEFDKEDEVALELIRIVSIYNGNQGRGELMGDRLKNRNRAWMRGPRMGLMMRKRTTRRAR